MSVASTAVIRRTSLTGNNLSVTNALTANNATYAFGKTEGNLNVNNATTAYGKTEGNLNVNNATTAYGKTEGNLNVNSAVNLNGGTTTTNSTGLYTGANVTINVSTIAVGNSTVNVRVTQSQILVNGATINSSTFTGTANNATYAFGKSEGGLNVNSAVNLNGGAFTTNASVLWANAVIKASGTAGRVVLPVGTNLYAT